MPRRAKLFLPLTAAPPFYNVRDFGAAGGGRARGAASIARAMAASAKAVGGTALVPAGRYPTGSPILHPGRALVETEK